MVDTITHLGGNDNGVAQWFQDVGAVFTAVVTFTAVALACVQLNVKGKHTSWVVVANGKWQGHGRARLGQRGASHGSTADGGSVQPDNLTEVTPTLKVGHVGVGFSVQSLVVHHFVVVHHVGDDFIDFVGVDTIGNVLAVASGGAKGATSVSSEIYTFQRSCKVLTYRGGSRRCWPRQVQTRPRFRSRQELEQSGWNGGCCESRGSWFGRQSQ